MAISIYDQFVPVFTQMLSALDKVLSKAEADAAARKIDLDVFVNGRLAPDMLPLTRQIQIMTDQAKGWCQPPRGPGVAEVGRRREDLRRSARARREDDRAPEDVQAGAVRRRRDARDRAQVSERDVQLHGQGLLAELRDPELLLPLHDGLRDPAPQRRADRQGRLPRQQVACVRRRSFPAPASERPLRGRREVRPCRLAARRPWRASAPDEASRQALRRSADGRRSSYAWNTATSGVLE